MVRYVDRPISLNKYKYIDFGFGSDVNVTTTGFVISSIHIIPTGPQAYQRIGKRVWIDRIDYRLETLLAGVIGSSTCTSTQKYDLLIDNNCKGNNLGYTEVYNSADINAFENMTSIGRFTFLKRMSFKINSMLYYGTGANVMPKVHVETGSIKCHVPIDWSPTNTDGAVSSTSMNCIRFIGIADNNSCSILNGASAFRVYFYDD